MDKTFSTRLDESIAERITALARQLRVSKKTIVEQAIVTFAAKLESQGQGCILDQTFGAWQRPESAGETVRRARSPFRQSMDRRRQ